MGFVGADEAGKGPVLGSMFAAAVRVPDPAVLPGGIKDSKALTPGRRAELEASLAAADRVETAVAEVPVERIDRPGSNMLSLTVRAQARAIRRVARAGDRGTVDGADVDADRFGRRVRDACRIDMTLEAEHGADETHAVVSAASVIAKQAREAHVAELATEYGDVGSGYPSDPTTRSFLREYVRTHGDIPACARRSWGTSQDVLAAVEQSALDSF